MNRNQFMIELERLLSGLADSEREEALKYYNDYFDDAGPENEAKVIEELKSPEHVARIIREGMAGGSAEYTENGYTDARFQENQEIPAPYRAKPSAREEKERSSRQPGSRLWKILCLILLAILLIPVVFPLGIAAMAVVLTCIIGVIGIGFAFAASGAAVLCAGIAVIIYGFWTVFSEPAIGLCVSGAGFLLLALGILFSLAVIWVCIHFVPWAVRGLVALIRYPFRKAGILQ